MTCVTGYVGTEDGRTYVAIGADSAGVSPDHEVTVRDDPKLFEVEGADAYIGYTTSFRMGQLLMYADANDLFGDPALKPSHRNVVEHVIPNVRDLFDEGGFMREDDDNGWEKGGTFLLAWGDKLFRISSDFQVGVPRNGYAAVGCGRKYALGSIYTYRHTNLDTSDAEHIVEKALEAAERHNGGVCEPFKVETTRGVSHG